MTAKKDNVKRVLRSVLVAVLAIAAWAASGAAPWVLGCAFAIVLAVAMLSYSLEQDEERKSAMAGQLDASAKTLLPHELPKIELGDSGAILAFSGPKGDALLRMFGDSSLVIENRDGQVEVSTKVKDREGTLIAELVRNEWSINKNTAYDRNYSTDALEVRDSTGDIVLQVRAAGDRIQLQGKFYGRNDKGVGIGKMIGPDGKVGGCIEITGPERPEMRLHIEPIFKYPSSQHLGQRA